jgi:hypothetical protein
MLLFMLLATSQGLGIGFVRCKIPFALLTAGFLGCAQRTTPVAETPVLLSAGVVPFGHQMSVGSSQTLDPGLLYVGVCARGQISRGEGDHGCSREHGPGARRGMTGQGEKTEGATH